MPARVKPRGRVGIRWRIALTFLSLFSLVGVLLTSRPTPLLGVTASWVHSTYPTSGSTLQPCDSGHPNRLYYAIASSAVGYTSSIQGGDQWWATEGLDNAVRLWNDNTEALYVCNTSIYVDAVNAGTSGYVAEAVDGDSNNACPSQAATTTCIIHINTAIFGNYDGVQTMAHEMGHWLGLDHSDILHACDKTYYPAPGCGWGVAGGNLNGPVDQSTPAAMQTSDSPSGIDSATCDDMQGFEQARFSYYQNLLADPSFEYGGGTGNPGLCWHFRPSSAGGSATDYNVAPGAQSYSWWVEFNGGGRTNASLQQDMWVDGPMTTFAHVRFWLRDRSTTTWLPAVIAIWNLNTNQTIASASVSVPPDNTWHYYNVYNVTVPQDTPIRFEIYNNSTINLDVDSGEVGPLGP